MKKIGLITVSLLLLYVTCYSITSDTSIYAKYLTLGQKARVAENYELSIQYLKKGRALATSDLELLKVYNSLGGSYYMLTDFHTALFYYDSVNTLLDSSSYPIFSCYLKHNYALIYMQIEKFEQAISNYKYAAQCMDENGLGILYFNLGKCYDYLNNPDDAKKYYTLSYEHNCRVLGKTNFYSISAGLELIDHGEDLINELYPIISTLDNKLLKGLYYSLSGEYQKAEEHLKTYNSELLKFYLKSKQWHKAVSVIDSLRSSYISLDSKLLLQKNERLIYKNAVDLSIKTDTLEAFQYAQMSHSNLLRETVDIELRQFKDSYNYFDFDSVIYIFVCKSDAINFYKVDANPEFWTHLTNFQNALKIDTARGTDYYNNYLTICKDGEYLYNKLVVDVSEQMLIIPSGRLQYLPFECLPVELPKDMTLPDYKNIHYLIKESTISYDYVLRNYPTNTFRSTISAFAPDTTLSFAVDEVRSLRIFKSNRYIGDRANLSEISKGDILHLATHYSPLDYSIKFNDSTLKLNALTIQKRSLVILSTCQSGAGIMYFGEGVYSPGRAFYISGAESILESSWNASDPHSYFIVWNFYKQLILRKDKATSLKQAKLKYLHDCPSHLAHPFYWANYRLFGNNAPLRIQLNRNYLIVIFGATFLLIIVFKKLLGI